MSNFEEDLAKAVQTSVLKEIKGTKVIILVPEGQSENQSDYYYWDEESMRGFVGKETVVVGALREEGWYEVAIDNEDNAWHEDWLQEI